jgi:CobQ-like glutamine amidotransferase family enzyme
MKITTNIDLTNFEFWGGAEDNADKLTSDQLQQIDNILSEDNAEGFTDFTINDLFRFDFGCVCQLIGLEYDEDSGEIVDEEDDIDAAENLENNAYNFKAE